MIEELKAERWVRWSEVRRGGECAGARWSSRRQWRLPRGKTGMRPHLRSDGSTNGSASKRKGWQSFMRALASNGAVVAVLSGGEACSGLVAMARTTMSETTWRSEMKAAAERCPSLWPCLSMGVDALLACGSHIARTAYGRSATAD